MSFKHCHWAVVVFLCKLTPSFSYFRLVARLLQWLPRQGPQIRGEEMKIRWLTQNLVLLKTPDEESSLEYVDSWANNDKQKLNLSGLTQGNLKCAIVMESDPDQIKNTVIKLTTNRWSVHFCAQVKFYGCRHVLLEEYDIIREELIKREYHKSCTPYC